MRSCRTAYVELGETGAVLIESLVVELDELLWSWVSRGTTG